MGVIITLPLTTALSTFSKLAQLIGLLGASCFDWQVISSLILQQDASTIYGIEFNYWVANWVDQDV